MQEVQWVWQKVSMEEQGILTKPQIPGCVKHDSRLREGILHLFLALERCVQFGTP